ncbi:TIGR02171 family protein [Candidatus Saccharibacteria bacterium]|nr:TIGR02171 family protein [Candidatus Saccharibacteria bacterium]
MNYWRILFLSLFVVACSNSESNRSSEEPPSDGGEDIVGTNTEPEIVEKEGMIHIENGSVTIGSNDKDYKANERPAMKVLLNYDFYMGIHEVTCGEYAKVAKKTELNTFGKCENDSLPLTDVTYYDAILFANAKSKLDEYDTAYTYSKAIYDSEGHCTNLEGFAFHAEVNAFRLPTEAEWVYAATKAWNTKNSWNNGNSEYKLHPVCSKGTDSTGFCDMAGNAMEWVNDWLGQFHDTTVTNYVGAPDGGDTGERIVKGGSYSSSEKELNPYSRGDVYTVTSSTRAEYVGFRLAFGSIPDALWMNDDGTSASSIVTPLVGPENIKNLTGTYNAKLAFRNDVSGNISYLNYRNGTLSIKEITKGINAFHPEISPDGNWIAYSTGFEGISGKSTIYVQSLESDTTISIKLKTESAAIPRWQVLENGDTVIVYVNDAGNNKDEATFKGNSTWQVKFANGKFGTPQKLFDGAYHGGFSEDRTLAVSGARILRARVAKKGSTVTDKANDVVWYDSAQACNVSLSQDGTKRTAFLDFAGKPGKKFAGEDYSTHERVFIADSNGKLIQSIKAPSGYTFDHTEWATNGERSIIVATLTNVNGAHTKIALVDPADNSITEIAEGDELWHPNLWIKKINSTDLDTTFNLNLDSAGVYYNNSDADNYAIQWRYKMEMLWQYKDTTNVIVLGSSRALFGVNPLLFDEPFFVLNLANMKNTKYGSKYIFHNYVIPHFKNLKYVFISMDIDRWYHDDNYNFFYSKYKNYPGYIYDANHNFWVGNVPQNLFDITFESLGQASYAKKLRPTRGFQKSRSKGWEQENVPIKRDSMWYTNNSTVYYKNYDLLIDIVKEAAEHNITVIGVEFPQSPAFKTTGSYAQFGLQRSQIPYLFEEINNISKTYPNFIFVDENKMGDHDYSEDMAQDAGHLSTEGAAKMSIRLDSLLRTLE